jgi:antagonist of KipI
MCVAGGFQVQEFLGSSSTHILSGMGGFAGRALRKKDVIAIGNQRLPFQNRRVAGKALEYLSPRKVLRVTEGPQSELFRGEAGERFYGGTYRVTEECNRMGLRLDGQAVATSRDVSMISEGVSLGAVQITAAGLPIILFVEQQTAGGYPKIANVISADMHSVGQLRPRDEIRFELVTFESARQLLSEQEELMASAELIEE